MGLPSVGGGAPAMPYPPSASDVAPLKARISQALQQGKTLAQAVQDARGQSANDAALAEAAILAQEEYALARQASAKPPAKPADPLPGASTQVRQTHLFSDDTLNVATQALDKPAAPAASANAGKPAAPPAPARVGQDMQAIAAYRQSGMSWQQAINAVRIDQGGQPADETALAEAALALEGPQHLDALADGGDPVAAARPSLDALHVFAAPVLDAAAHAMQAPDAKAAPKPAATVRTAQTQLDRDRAAHAAPDVIARDETALHTALADALQAAYPDGPPDWTTDPTRADWLWHAQWQVLKDVLGPDAPNLTPAQVRQRTQDLSVSMQAAIVLRDAQGGTAGTSGTQTLAAVRRLGADLQGLDPNDPVYREVMGDGAVIALEDAATREIAGPVACVANQDARAHLAAIAGRLGAYRGTSLYDTLVRRVLADPAATTLFDSLAPASRLSRPEAHAKLTQVADILDAASASPELAAALYQRKFAGSRDGQGVLYWIAHHTSDDYQKSYYADVARIYADIGGNGSAAGRSVRQAVTDRLTGNDPVEESRGGGGGYNPYSGVTMPGSPATYGIGDGVKDGDTRGQLYQDILDAAPDSPAGQIVARETGYKTSRPAPAAQPAPATTAARLPGLDGQITVTSDAQLINLLGANLGLEPAHPAGTPSADGTQAAQYDLSAKVYQDTTLGDILRSIESAAGVTRATTQTPITLSLLPVDYWRKGQDPSHDKPSTLAVAEVHARDGSIAYVGPSDTSIRHRWSDWVHHSGFSDGQMAALPHRVLGRDGTTPLNYVFTHETGDHPWYSWDNIKTGLEIGGLAIAGILAMTVAPEGAPLWLALAAEVSDAVLTTVAVAGTVQSVQTLASQQTGPDGQRTWGYQHWQNWLMLGANAFGAMAGGGALAGRSAALFERAGVIPGAGTLGSGTLAGLARTSAVLSRPMIRLPALGLNLGAMGVNGWQMADAAMHDRPVAIADAFQFALSGALMAVGVHRARAGNGAQTPSPQTTPAQRIALVAPGFVVPRNAGLLRPPAAPDGWAVRPSGLLAPDLPHGTHASPGSRLWVPGTPRAGSVRPSGLIVPSDPAVAPLPDLSIASNGTPSYVNTARAWLRPISLAAVATGARALLPDAFVHSPLAWLADRGTLSVAGKFRSLTSKSLSLTLKRRLQHGLERAQAGDADGAAAQIRALTRHRAALGLPHFAVPMGEQLIGDLAQIARARRTLTRLQNGGANTAQVDAARKAYDGAVRQYKANGARMGKTLYFTTWQGKAMRAGGMFLSSTSLVDALLDPSLSWGQKAVYTATGIYAMATQGYYMHAMTRYSATRGPQALSKLGRASKLNDSVYAANAAGDSTLGVMHLAGGALLPGWLGLVQAGGESLFFLANRRTMSRPWLIAAGTGLLLMTGSATAAHVFGGHGDKDKSPDGAPQPAPLAWRMAPQAPLPPGGARHRVAAFPLLAPVYVTVQAAPSATGTLWDIAAHYRDWLLDGHRSANAPRLTDDQLTDLALVQLLDRNPGFDPRWQDGDPLSALRHGAPAAVDPDLVLPGQQVRIG